MDSIKCLFILFIINTSINLFKNNNEVNGEDAKRYLPNWESVDSRPLPNWFDESKIGIFIHWGVFSVPSVMYKYTSMSSGSEWFWWNWVGAKNKDLTNFMSGNYRPDFTYQDFAKQFTAEFYDPKKWADIFKASGAKYVVLTTKHHEGFTLWPSKTSWNWNSVDVGPNRDLTGDLATAIRSAGLKFGAYHSWYEWFNPLYLRDKTSNWTSHDFVKFKARPELEELVNKYKPEVLFSDGEWEAPDTYWNSADFLAWLYNDSPVKDTIVVNDRWGSTTRYKHGGYYSGADRFNPGTLQKHKWENAMTIDKYTWGFNRNSPLSSYMTTQELITILAQTISCGGNILINVGPTHDGIIAPIFEERLRDLGSWLSVNGEAIYSSKPWTHQNDTITKNIWYTSKDKIVFSIALNWRQNNQLLLGAVDYKIVNSIQMLGFKGNLNFKESGEATLVEFPNLTPESLRWAYVLKITTK